MVRLPWDPCILNETEIAAAVSSEWVREAHPIKQTASNSWQISMNPIEREHGGFDVYPFCMPVVAALAAAAKPKRRSKWDEAWVSRSLGRWRGPRGQA